MATIQLPRDFKEFLQLLNTYKVEYLIVGGYAVGYYGYPRATGDMGVWIAFHPNNVRNMAEALRQFGFAIPEPVDSFLSEGQFVGLGNSPLRIEILTSITGVNFAECYADRTQDTIDGIAVSFIGLRHLKVNKRAAGRFKDLSDLQNLPES